MSWFHLSLSLILMLSINTSASVIVNADQNRSSIGAQQLKVSSSSDILSFNQSSLEVAEKAAKWVMSRAVIEAGGYKWGYYSPSGKLFYSPDLSGGASGIGMFFLLLYDKTRNSSYLDFARGAANWITSQAIPADGGYKWPHPDDDIPTGWYLTAQGNGASGIGEFLLKMYQTTENSTYLIYAEGTAQWMMAHAVAESGGYYVP